MVQWTMVKVTITNNSVKDTDHNSIQAVNCHNGAIAIVTDNTMENWGLADNDGHETPDDPSDDGPDGRAFRGSAYKDTTAASMTFENNVMKHSGAAPEEFVKITGTITTVKVDGNYWGSASPDFATIVYNYNLGDIDNYYSDADLTNKVSL